MTSTRSRVDGLRQVLKYDAAEFSRRAEKRPYTMAREAGIPDRLLRGLDDPRKWSPTLKTLFRVEEAFEQSEHWPGSGSSLWRETGTEQGFLIRRLQTNWRHPNFQSVIDVWESVTDKQANLDDVLRFDGVTLVDVRSRDPREFRIERHSPDTVHATGTDNTGQYLGTHRADFYRDALMSEYLWTKATGEPQLAEIVWAAEGTEAGAYFRRLVLPVEDRIVSVVEILRSGLTIGRLRSETKRPAWA